MPHIIIEYAHPIADNHDMNAICSTLFEAAMATGVFKTREDVKVRALPASHWFQEVENSTFAHVTVRLMEGRTLEQKAMLTRALLEKADELLPDVGTISVDIKELDPKTYQRRTK